MALLMIQGSYFLFGSLFGNFGILDCTGHMCLLMNYFRKLPQRARNNSALVFNRIAYVKFAFVLFLKFLLLFGQGSSQFRLSFLVWDINGRLNIVQVSKPIQFNFSPGFLIRSTKAWPNVSSMAPSCPHWRPLSSQVRSSWCSFFQIPILFAQTPFRGRSWSIAPRWALVGHQTRWTALARRHLSCSCPSTCLIRHCLRIPNPIVKSYLRSRSSFYYRNSMVSPIRFSALHDVFRV